jgi:hypothetical protein
MPEKDMEHALAFDRVKAVDHKGVGMMPAELIAVLKKRSAERVKDSKDFAKLAKDIERVKGLRDRKQVPLNEAELKEQMSKEEADDADPEKGGKPDEPKADNAVYKFPRNFLSTEILKIMEDVLQGKKLLPAQQGRFAPGGPNHALRLPTMRVGTPVLMTNVASTSLNGRSDSSAPR